MKKNLTNSELIAILSKRDLNAPADIYIDYCTFYGDYDYPEVEEDSGVCYSEEDDRLIVCAGEFECQYKRRD